MTGVVKAIARKAKPRADMETLSEVAVTIEAGLDGDFRGSQRIRQVTILFAEDWADACAELKADLPWTTRRANFLVAGFRERIEAKQLGARLTIGPVLLEVTEETDPCGRMEEQFGGLKAALAPNWRGGICCRVVTGGHIRGGDKVALA